MAIFRYLTHPQVTIDPAVEVPQWGLSEKGKVRANLLAASDALVGTQTIISSDEVKAIETATPIARALRLDVKIVAASHENDRRATGFLQPSEFEKAADQFFAQPETSYRGWERAIDAQVRILGVFDKVTAQAAAGDILMVGHGGVGTLLYCALTQQSIAQSHDQCAGGGCLWNYNLDTRVMTHRWRSIEEVIQSS